MGLDIGVAIEAKVVLTQGLPVLYEINALNTLNFIVLMPVTVIISSSVVCMEKMSEIY